MTSRKLNTAIREVLTEAPTTTEWGVAVLDTKTFKPVAGVNQRMRAEALSISKLTTAWLFGRLIDSGGMTPDFSTTVFESDVRAGGYLGRLVGQEINMMGLMRGMLHISDTTGQRALTRLMGGPDPCNRVLEARPLESRQGERTKLTVTRFIPVRGETGAEAKFYTGNSTPTEAAGLLGAALGSSLTREALQRNIFGYGLTRDLPGNEQPDAQFLEALARVQDKTTPLGENTLTILQNPSWRSEFPKMMGIDEDQRHDVAQIGGLIVASFATGYDLSLPENSSHPAHNIQAMIGQAVYAYA